MKARRLILSMRSEINPEYVARMKRDQSLNAYISILFQEILVYLSDCTATAEQVWKELIATYQILKWKILFLRKEFQNLSKGTMPVMDYLRRVREVADQLGVAENLVSDKEKVQQILSKLGPNFMLLIQP